MFQDRFKKVIQSNRQATFFGKKKNIHLSNKITIKVITTIYCQQH